mgnify:CR=1 FL=1
MPTAGLPELFRRLAVIACGGASIAWIEEQVRIARSMTDNPIGANVMLMDPQAHEVADVLAKLRVDVITTGAGSPGKYIEQWKEAGAKVVPVVASSALAARMQRCGADAVIAVTDPVYPVYVDSNAMAGRAGEYADGKWDRLVYLPCNAENGFVPALPDKPVDVIYLCYPNNPTGTVLNREQLTKWVNYARENGALIIYDAAYRAFVSTPDIPLSIYEIDGAKECAIECNSFSKTAGFTGTRCGYTVVPHAVKGLNAKGEPVEMNALWKRRMSTKFNGVSYIIQCGANAVFTPEGQKGVKENIAYYQENAAILMDALDECGITYFGGKNSPYIWLKCPDNMGSWEFFDKLLEEANVVGTPGEGFGENGKGYLRLTSFSTHENTREAMERLKKLLNK